MEDNKAVLLYGPSSNNSNLYYATRFYSEDDFAYISTNKKETIIVYDMEKGRAKKESRVLNVAAVSDLERGVFKTLEYAVCKALEQQKIEKLTVPYNFSVGMADFFRKEGFKIQYDKHFFMHERSIKTKEEVAAMVQVQRAIEYAVEEALNVISKARVRKGQLHYHGTILTSEYIERLIGAKLIKRNCTCPRMIVASGDDACDVHSSGEGPLEAHKAIVIDIFPKSLQTFYHADMTRTVAKGNPSKELRQLYKAVKKAQGKALCRVKAGVKVSNIEEEVRQFFEGEGYKTGMIDGKLQGFIHGLGHGIGLDLHEGFNIPLEEGEIITVEPGLYYSGMGGVRLEDMVLVTRDGCKNLTVMSKRFVL